MMVQELAAGLMHIFHQAKPEFQKRLYPLVNQLAHWGITPNQITVSAIALSSLTGLAITWFPSSPVPLLWLPAVLLGRMILNAIDGMLAREHGLASHLGCILNELGDVLSDIALYLPFALIPGVCAPLVVGEVILAILTELAGVLGLAIAQHRSSAGPMGKSKRACLFAVLGLLLGFGVDPGFWLSILWVVACVLTGWTVVSRVRDTLQEMPSCF